MKLLTVIFIIMFSSIACQGSSETKPVKNNVLKEYVKTPLDKTKSMKAEVEAKQRQAQEQLKSIGD